MKIFKIAQVIDKEIEWKCPKTGVYILAFFMGNSLVDGYHLYHSDGSFIDIFDNFWNARNWAKNNLGVDCQIPSEGRRVDKQDGQEYTVAPKLDQTSYQERYDRWRNEK